jgi:hypothetical protein
MLRRTKRSRNEVVAPKEEEEEEELSCPSREVTPEFDCRY